MAKTTISVPKARAPKGASKTARSDQRAPAAKLPKHVDFSAGLTIEQMQKHEARSDVGIMRRITYASLTRSGRQLIETVDLSKAETAKPLLDMLDFAENYRDYAQANLEIATAAAARLALVLRYLAKEGERLDRSESKREA